MKSAPVLLTNRPVQMGRLAKISIVFGLGLGAASTVALPVAAIDFDWNNGAISGSFDTTVSTGVSARTQGHDHRLIGVNNGGTANSINGDNGNLNYEKGDITSANVKATHELSLNAGDFGFFGRASYFYDTAIMDGDTARTDLGNEAKGRAGKDFELLDAYVFGDFDVGDVPVTVRVGNQVLSWGESTFIQNGINTINPIDVTKFRVAGAEVREGLIPVPIIDVNVGLTDKLSIEGFLQLEWDNTEIEPEGTFFSTNDFASPGGEFVFLNFGRSPFPSDNPPTTGAGLAIPRGADRTASDNNQWGVALRYFEPALNDTEFGLYYIQYNSRLPVLSARTGTFAGLLGGDYAGSAQYFREFPDDVVAGEGVLGLLYPDARAHLDIGDARFFVQLSLGGDRRFLVPAHPTTGDLPPVGLVRVDRVVGVDQEDATLSIEEDHPGGGPAQSDGHRGTLPGDPQQDLLGHGRDVDPVLGPQLTG